MKIKIKSDPYEQMKAERKRFKNRMKPKLTISERIARKDFKLSKKETNPNYQGKIEELD